MIRLRGFWDNVRDSLWFLPSVITIGAVVLAFVMLLVDRRLQTSQSALIITFGGGAAGARGVLSAIAGSIITVTGVVFSLTMVALQLASTQFTPRVMRNFISDRASQSVLGVLIGSFTYSLIVLRSVRNESTDGGFVPALSVGIAIVLALVSVGFLIFFIHHAANAIRASTIVNQAASDTLRCIERQYPRRFEPEPPARPQSPPKDRLRVISAEDSGYVGLIDFDRLETLAAERNWQIRIEPGIGEFILPGQPLASAWPVYQLPEDAASTIRRAFVLRSERTQRQDVELGLHQLVDIAVRALSPGINDPTTASTCLDRIAEALVSLGNRDLSEPKAARKLERVHGPRQMSYERAVLLGIQQIRHYATGHPVITVKILETLERIAQLVPAERRYPLAQQAVATLDGARQSITVRSDREQVESAGRDALATIGLAEDTTARTLLHPLTAGRSRRA